jgi:ribosomal protein L5
VRRGDIEQEALDAAVSELEQITGQKPVKTKARKSIANFKLRAGYEIGAKVNLRGDYMWEFLDRLMNVALPRVKDFRGVNPNAFDGHGNYSLGIAEQIIFPEIDYDKIERVSGLNVAIVTTAKTDQEGRSLLAKLECLLGNSEVYMAKKSMIVKAQRKPKFSTRRVNSAESAAGRGAICASSRCAEFASGNLRAKA